MLLILLLAVGTNGNCTRMMRSDCNDNNDYLSRREPCVCTRNGAVVDPPESNQFNYHRITFCDHECRIAGRQTSTPFSIANYNTTIRILQSPTFSKGQ
jgi:hypothetical protein